IARHGRAGASLQRASRAHTITRCLPMSKRFPRFRIFSCVPALAVLVSAGVSRAESVYYTWQTEEGATAFTDDLRSVPEAYRAPAERRTFSKLSGYRHLTPTDPQTSAVA